jgi:hypothetical protein
MNAYFIFNLRSFVYFTKEIIMIPKYDYQDKCWWCSNQADSKEHKYKRSDLIREFGSGSYSGDRELVRVFENQTRKIQGPNSNEVKFSSNLCRNCNNNRSQPFDLSYDAFTTYLKNNESDIWSSQQFKLSTIYGSNWIVERDNLVKYYVKHICCRLVSDKVFIKPEIIDFLDGNSNLKYISMKAEIREDIVALIQHSAKSGEDVGGLWIGNMECMISQSTGELSDVTSFIGYRWFRLNYIYDDNILVQENSFSEDLVILISNYNVDPTTIINMP